MPWEQAVDLPMTFQDHRSGILEHTSRYFQTLVVMLHVRVCLTFSSGETPQLKYIVNDPWTRESMSMQVPARRISSGTGGGTGYQTYDAVLRT